MNRVNNLIFTKGWTRNDPRFGRDLNWLGRTFNVNIGRTVNTMPPLITPMNPALVNPSHPTETVGREYAAIAKSEVVDQVPIIPKMEIVVSILKYYRMETGIKVECYIESAPQGTEKIRLQHETDYGVRDCGADQWHENQSYFYFDVSHSCESVSAAYLVFSTLDNQGEILSEQKINFNSFYVTYPEEELRGHVFIHNR